MGNMLTAPLHPIPATLSADDAATLSYVGRNANTWLKDAPGSMYRTVAERYVAFHQGGRTRDAYDSFASNYADLWGEVQARQANGGYSSVPTARLVPRPYQQ
jgi:hypothetical protein